ncbi:TonB-dependent receptor plug domain-containing protein [Luteimonas salinilitoris]|uniref:TonB-dependent receptor plug domain-containing protein n=1 Tax=Luteimonas salinilitoris TaxID=3237697 RepID=A0ABV4HN90_9GAMM
MQRRPLALALALALASPAALAQSPTADEPAPRDRATTLDTLIVTGTRVADRTVAESASPIDIISPETLESTGTVELATALSRALPSLNFPRPAITDGTDAVRPAQLRGLAPDQVLVLVNGKRRHTTALINLNGSQGRGSSPVDLNAIPIAAIERVEVLRDGASAQYGSDAIAGVINIVLKGSDAGGSIAARYGQYSAGDGEQYQVSGDGGIALGEAGFLHLAAQAGHQDQTDRARPFQGTPTASSPPLGAVVQRYGDPEVDSRAVSYNAEISPAEGVVFYSFGTYSKRDALSNGFFRPAGDNRNIPEIYPDGFLPNIRNIADDRAGVIGLRGTTAGGTGIDISFNHGINHLTFDVENSLNRTLGPTSPTNFHAGALEVSQNVLNLDFNKILDVGLEYPVAVAWGAEWRGEKFNQSPGEPASYADANLILPDGSRAPPGAQVFPGFQPSNAGQHDRHSYSFYLDAEADLGDRFSAGLAARYENYSDFGSTTSGKLSARYAISDAVALRGTVSTGFRAPSLQQQHFQSTSTNFIGGVPFEVRTFAVDDPVAVALGAEPLKAEESTNVSLGLVLQPVDALYVTIDAYQIDIDDRIILSENLVGDAVRDFLERPEIGIFGVNGGRYFTNAIDTRTRGVDLIGTYRWALGAGNLDFTAGFNYNDTDIRRIAPNPPELETGDLDLERIGRVEQGRVTVGAPSDKLFLSGVWNSGSWTLSAAATRYGEFEVLNGDPARDQTFGAEWTLDVSAAYAIGGWDFTVGADNVFDAYPDEVIFVNSNSGQLPYSAASPFGFNGAFAYGRIGYRW